MEEKKKKKSFFEEYSEELRFLGFILVLNTMSQLLLDNIFLRRTNVGLRNRVVELEGENQAQEKQLIMLAKENSELAYHLGRTFKTVKNGERS